MTNDADLTQLVDEALKKRYFFWQTRFVDYVLRLDGLSEERYKSLLDFLLNKVLVEFVYNIPADAGLEHLASFLAVLEGRLTPGKAKSAFRAIMAKEQNALINCFRSYQQQDKTQLRVQ